MLKSTDTPSLVAFSPTARSLTLADARLRSPPRTSFVRQVRSALKPAAKESAKLREAVYFKSAKWNNGQAEQAVITDLTEGAAGKLG